MFGNIAVNIISKYGNRKNRAKRRIVRRMHCFDE